MIIEDWDLEKVKNYPMYYVLQDFSTKYKNIYFKIKTPDQEIDFEDCQLFRLLDGNILVCFKPAVFKHFSDYSLEGYNGTKKEIINLQIFERIRPIYNLPPSNEQGAFLFSKSVKVEEESLMWRCDRSSYGPREYAADNTLRESLVSDLSDLLMYEPIISVNSVAHIIYGWAKNDQQIAEYIIDNDIVPSSTRTLSEIFKLVHEWSLVCDEPFNNIDNISADAKEFLSSIGFDYSLVQDQSDMQIVNYINGLPNARNRPDNIQPNSEELLTFVKKKVSYLTLPALLKLFPSSCTEEDFNNLVNSEKENILNAQKHLINEAALELDFYDTSNMDLVISGLEEQRQQFPLSTALKLFVANLAHRKELIDEIITSF